MGHTVLLVIWTQSNRIIRPAVVEENSGEPDNLRLRDFSHGLYKMATRKDRDEVYYWKRAES